MRLAALCVCGNTRTFWAFRAIFWR